MSKKTGFTLIEILTTVVIVGILAMVLIPNFTRTINRAEAQQAMAYLRAIRTAEKMYYAKWGNYFAATPAQIVSDLGAATNARGYTFSVTGGGTVFQAVATRNSDGLTIRHHEDGTWTGTYGTTARDAGGGELPTD